MTSKVEPIEHATHVQKAPNREYYSS